MCVNQSINRSINQSIHPSIYLSIYLSTYLERYATLTCRLLNKTLKPTYHLPQMEKYHQASARRSEPRTLIVGVGGRCSRIYDSVNEFHYRTWGFGGPLHKTSVNNSKPANVETHVSGQPCAASAYMPRKLYRPKPCACSNLICGSPPTISPQVSKISARFSC